MHRIGEVLHHAAAGAFPPADGAIEVVGPARPPVETVLSLTGHAVIATAVRPDVVHATGVHAFGGTVAPAFLLWLAGDGGEIGTEDLVLVATGRGDGGLPERADLDDHPRVRHARSLRTDVRVLGDERGLVTLGRGIGGLTELSVEVTADPGHDGADAAGGVPAGVGRDLVRGALGAVDAGELVVAEVAPGNARSLRAFLACGFRPVGSAVHVRPGSRSLESID